MMNKSNNLMFFTILIMSIMISISSNSWFTMWMGMEINMMSFMPLIMNQKNILSKESALTYFLIQTIASMLMIMSIMMNEVNNNMMNELMLLSSLMLKSGVSPFHFWLPKTMEGMNWNKCLILMTMQKLIPMMLMSTIIKINMITITIMMLSTMIGAIGGLNQTSLRKLMAYSSISNNGWMMLAMTISETLWMLYFMIYALMTIVVTTTMNTYNIYHINQIMTINEMPYKKMMMMMNMISISGLPPLLGFMPKWMVIQYSMSQNEILLTLTMMMMTLITVIYYLRIMYSSMMLTNMNYKWNQNKYMFNNLNMVMSMLSIIGLTSITMMSI
uniref:NADH dehydrogenase subunit 2 n=1 Tax=Stheneboea repudiosa TaxID=2779127 RepID=UPI0025A9877E|nr:NADH dehydrogenase subunit 2 [Stheneboea repudiosa]WID87120.1 NADH dehydrogenase subunit 2 [Stheneboea repudiosa]